MMGPDDVSMSCSVTHRFAAFSPCSSVLEEGEWIVLCFFPFWSDEDLVMVTRSPVVSILRDGDPAGQFSCFLPVSSARSYANGNVATAGKKIACKLAL